MKRPHLTYVMLTVAAIAMVESLSIKRVSALTFTVTTTVDNGNNASPTKLVSAHLHPASDYTLKIVAMPDCGWEPLHWAALSPRSARLGRLRLMRRIFLAADLSSKRMGSLASVRMLPMTNSMPGRRRGCRS